MKIARIFLSLTLVAIVAYLVASPDGEKAGEEKALSKAAFPIGGRVFPVSDASKDLDLDYLLRISRDELISLVPKQSGIRFTDCPACEGGAQDTGEFLWEPQNPRRIRCRSCNETYPGSKKFPDLKTLKVASRGETHLYPYFEREDGYRIYFQAHLDHLSRKYMAKAAQDLARMWWKTKDDVYARRAAEILVRFAEVYPGYALHYDYPFTQKVIVPPDHGIIKETATRPQLTAKWDYWTYIGISQELAEAYDILRYWPPLQEMAAHRAVELIEGDLLGGMLTLTLGYQEKHKNEETYTNMSPILWRDAIRAARLIRHPGALLDVLSRANTFSENSFLYDGSWHETSPSYGQQVYNSMLGIKAALSGAAESFAPGQFDDQKTAHLTRMESLLRIAMERQYSSLTETRFPNGGLLPINDTWSNKDRRPRSEMKPVLFPGMGVAIMGGGKGEDQFHSYLNFSGGTGHIQRAALSIGLWAHGDELLSDIGYTHTSHRYWATSTSSHNTVLVDGEDQKLDPNYSGNRLTLWSTNDHDFHIVEAESVTAYPKLERYRRTLIAIGQDSKDSYLVDAFQISGGQQHDYLLAGSADRKAKAQLNLPLEAYKGSIANRQRPFRSPKGENDHLTPEAGLTFIRNLHRASPSPTARLDFRTLQGAQTGVRSWIDCGGVASFFLGEAPSIRQAGEVEGAVKDYTMPMLVARRTGQNLRSSFVAVHAPLAGVAPNIETVDVRRLDGAIVITVHRGVIKDRIFLATENPARIRFQTPEGEVLFDGKAGWLRWEGGKVVKGELVNGTELASGGLRVGGGAPLRGVILEAVRSSETMECGGWFLVAERPPAGQKVDALIVQLADGTAHGYNILKIEAVEDGSRIYVKESPAIVLSADETRLLSFPQRTIPGPMPSYYGITRASFDALGK